MRCHDAQQYLGSYALGEVEGWARGALECHLEGCESCRAELAQLQSVIGQIYEAAGGEEPQPLQPLPDQPRSVPEPNVSSSGIGRPGRVLLIAAGLLLLGFAASWIWTEVRKSDDEPNADRQPFGEGELSRQIAEADDPSQLQALGYLGAGSSGSRDSRDSQLEQDGSPEPLLSGDTGYHLGRGSRLEVLRPQLSEAGQQNGQVQFSTLTEDLLESADELYVIREEPAEQLQALGYIGAGGDGEQWRFFESEVGRQSQAQGDLPPELLGRPRRLERARKHPGGKNVAGGLHSAQPANAEPATKSRDGEAAKSEPIVTLPQQLTAPATEGTLKAQVPGGDVIGHFPLEHTGVEAEISGFLARTQVRQRFGNPYTEPIEAVYVFPLPTNSAINGFVMQVGDRKIVGVVRPREEAERIYAEAKARGQTASLLSQERTNVFTQSVANIEPGGTVDIDITYFHTLDYQDGQYEYTFPMVVGPRYIPGAPKGATEDDGAVAAVDASGAEPARAKPGGGTSPDTDQVPDASRISPPVLKDGERSGHDISLRVSIDAGVLLSDVTSPTHDIAVEPIAAERARVVLASHDTIPNRDFVLRYRVTGPELQLGLLTHRTEKLGGFFALMLVPQLSPADADVTPREITFVIDNSGSMNGTPIALCRDMVKRTLQSLRPQDRFNIIHFAGSAGQLATRSLANTPENLQRGLSYLESLQGSGGTEMLSGVRAFLDSPVDEHHIQMVCFLTDGFVGNEEAILQMIREKGQHARWYAFGVGSSVNRMLIEGIAQQGRGRSTVLLPTDPEAAQEASDQFFAFMDSPVLTDIELDWGGLPVSDVYPSQPRDLFAGQPIVLVGLYDGAGSGELVVRGRAGTRDVSLVLPVQLPERSESHSALAPVWARSRIADLTDQLLGQPEDADSIRESIRDLAVDFQLVSQFTSFVAVDESRIVGNGRPLTILQPVEIPAFVNRATAVGEEPAGTARRIGAWGATLYLDPNGEISVAELTDGGELQRVADVSPGEVLCALNGIEIRGFQHLEALLLQAAGETVELSFRPAGQSTAPRRTVTLPKP